MSVMTTKKKRKRIVYMTVIDMSMRMKRLVLTRGTQDVT